MNKEQKESVHWVCFIQKILFHNSIFLDIQQLNFLSRAHVTICVQNTSHQGQIMCDLETEEHLYGSRNCIKPFVVFVCPFIIIYTISLFANSFCSSSPLLSPNYLWLSCINPPGTAFVLQPTNPHCYHCWHRLIAFSPSWEIPKFLFLFCFDLLPPHVEVVFSMWYSNNFPCFISSIKCLLLHATYWHFDRF